MSTYSWRGCKIHTVIHKGRNSLSLRPFRLRVELLRQAVPSAFISHGNFCKVVVQDGLMEVGNKLYTLESHCRGSRLCVCVLTRLTTSGIAAKATCWAICCWTAMSVASSILDCAECQSRSMMANPIGIPRQTHHQRIDHSDHSCRLQS